MKSIFTLLQDIERLIYKVLMWVVLFPKTIVKITMNPSWAPVYIKSELNEGESRFDEYMSPVILLLVVALIPAVAALYLLPTFGATITSPASANPITDRYLFFEAQTELKSSREDIEYRHRWWVVKSSQDGTGFEEIYTETHTSTGDKVRVDKDTIRDNFRYNFQEGGVYYVNVLAESVDHLRGEVVPLETHYSGLKVIVPVKLDEPVSIPNPSTDTPVFGSTTEPSPAEPSAGAPESRSIEALTSQIQKEKTIFLALALMLPPLLFALAAKIFMGENIGENTLKESFYVQCYYFSPLSFAIWATYFARYFFTADAYFFVGERLAVQLLFLPVLLAILWFIRAEVKDIAWERKTSITRALIIVLVCLGILGFGAYLFIFFPDYENGIRLFAIQIYPVIAILFIVGFVVAWFGRRRAKGEGITIRTAAWTAAAALVVFGALTILPTLLIPAPVLPAATEPIAAAPTDDFQSTSPPPVIPASEQPTEVAVENTPLPTPNPFFIEEFNTDLATWFEFMTSGDSRMVEWKLEGGALAVQLFKREGNLPRFYLVNDAFTYSDVKVEAVVTNRGNNSNGVGLICRYSNIGWYEVQVSNSQTFAIYVVDNVGIVSQGYNLIVTNDFNKIKSGPSTNVYSMVCKGDVISLYVNDALAWEFTDTKYGLAEGKVGLSAWSPQKLPVNVDIETLTVSAP
jgi:hypothetical protein